MSPMSLRATQRWTSFDIGDGPIEEVTLSIGRTTEHASPTTSVEQPAHLFTNLLLRPITLFVPLNWRNWSQPRQIQAVSCPLPCYRFSSYRSPGGMDMTIVVLNRRK